MTQEALKLAIEALKFAYNHCDSDWVQDEKINPAITALEEALAQTQEPVVYQCPRCATSMQVDLTAKAALAQTQEPVAQPASEEDMKIYKTIAANYHKDLSTPPQRTWVGLTDEERSQLVTLHHGWNEYGQAIEAKLKEKNT